MKRPGKALKKAILQRLKFAAETHIVPTLAPSASTVCPSGESRRCLFSLCLRDSVAEVLEKYMYLTAVERAAISSILQLIL